MVDFLEGIYILIIEINKQIRIRIGALGDQIFQKGTYAYVGSAQKNLEQRVKRHFKKEKNKFWHIDYILDNKSVKIKKILYKQAEKKEECTTANQISQRGIPVKGFGCSDCNCESHLFQVNNFEFLEESTTAINLDKI